MRIHINKNFDAHIEISVKCNAQRKSNFYLCEFCLNYNA